MRRASASARRRRRSRAPRRRGRPWTGWRRRSTAPGRGGPTRSRGPANVSAGKASSASFVSCMHSTSGCDVGEPLLDAWQADLQRVDVPGGDAHASTLPAEAPAVSRRRASTAFCAWPGLALAGAAAWRRRRRPRDRVLAARARRRRPPCGAGVAFLAAWRRRRRGVRVAAAAFFRGRLRRFLAGVLSAAGVRRAAPAAPRGDGRLRTGVASGSTAAAFFAGAAWPARRRRRGVGRATASARRRDRRGLLARPGRRCRPSPGRASVAGAASPALVAVVASGAPWPACVADLLGRLGRRRPTLARLGSGGVGLGDRGRPRSMPRRAGVEARPRRT